MRGKSAGIIQGAVWCRIVGFMFAMLIYYTGADALFAQADVSVRSADAVEQANDSIPQGTWEVTQVTVEKTADGKVERATNRDAQTQTFIPCPQIWEFKDSKSIVRHYLDGTEEISDYSLEEKQLVIHSPTALQNYQYTINGELMTLQITHNYVNNLPDGQTLQIEEKWSIVIRKQQ